MAKELFLEIGTEEIPAGFLPTALRDLDSMIRREFDSARIAYGAVRTFATPRRLVLVVSDVAEQQQRQQVEIAGPSVQVAFDAEGQPTRAALGFARSNGVDVADLEQRQTDKGTYLFLSRVIEGQPVADQLPEMLQRLVTGLSFRKSMRWADLDVRFARPVHWLVALFGGELVSVHFGNLTSGRTSRGHRFMAPAAFEVADFNDYLAKTREHFVIVDAAERKRIIADEIARVAREHGGALNVDEQLLDEVAYLVEYPTPLCGSFDEAFLQLPDELLITSMKAHQRYFTLTDPQGRLLPKFITISNTRPVDPAVVVRGNERVLRARLSDAMFFWKEDQKHKLESRLDALKNVVYQAQLGTSYEKVERFTALAETLARQLRPADVELTRRAARLAKCDLETGMVYEFPELQGVMGREYARLEGENPRVALAIYEHYLPVQAGGALPTDDIGAFVSLADKLDTLCGCFGVGLIPTGTADPYALRRSAIGILNIILDRGYVLSLPTCVAQAVAALEPKLTRPAAQVQDEVVTFLRQRLLNMLTAQEFPADVVEAVLAVRFDDVCDARRRVQALADFKQQDGFAALAATFKRAGNIIKGHSAGPVDPARCEQPCEAALLAALEQVEQALVADLQVADYAAALQRIAGLRPAVDAFFDGVMVMVEDTAVKDNRLALLTRVSSLFSGLADFSRLTA